MLRVTQISFFVDPQRRAPEQLLVDWHALADVARSVARSGVNVSVVQASRVEGVLRRDGVDYHFVAPENGLPLSRSPRFAALMRTLEPDVIHVHGLHFAREVIGLRALLPHTTLLLQDHADRPPRFWRRALFRRGMAAAQGVAFCARAQAEPFVRKGDLGARVPVFEVPESTTTFTPGDRAAARAATGVDGDPAVLWVGHLDANKDPWTVLDAVAELARELTGLRLWCCYSTAPLLDEVRARIDRDERLRGRVHLLGRVPRATVQQLMRAADVFVLASRREGCSFSLTEALASGLPAAVSDIPSSRALIGEAAEEAGILSPCGDSGALAAAIRALAARPRELTRARARARFENHLSETAIGRRLAEAYRHCAAIRSVS